MCKYQQSQKKVKTEISKEVLKIIFRGKFNV